MSCTSDLFPRGPVGSLTSVGELVVQSIPTILLLASWTLLELVPRARVQKRTKIGAMLFGFAGLGVLGVLVSRLFDLLACTNHGLSEGWRMLGTVGTPFFALIALAAGTMRFPRVATALFALGAGASVFVDRILRDRVDERAAQPLVPIQQTLCLLAVVCLAYLRGRRCPRTVVGSTNSSAISAAAATTAAATTAGATTAAAGKKCNTSFGHADPLARAAPPPAPAPRLVVWD